MSQQNSQSQVISGNCGAVSTSSRLSVTPTLIPPNSLTGKRLVFASPVPLQSSNNHAVTSLRLLLSKTETNFSRLSSKLDDLTSVVKYGQKEMAELNQIQQDDLAEVKRDLQEHVSRAQVAIQTSFSTEQRSPMNNVLETLTSVSARLDHVVSRFSELEETLSVQNREQKVLWGRLELMTRDLTKVSNTGDSFEESRGLDGRLCVLRAELLQSIHSEFSKLSEKISTLPSSLVNEIAPAPPAPSVYYPCPSLVLDPDVETSSTLPASTDATVVDRPISPHNLHNKAPGTPPELLTDYVPRNKLHEDILGLQEIDLPPAQPTAHPPVHSSGSRTIVSSERSLQHSDREAKKVSHLYRQKTRSLLPPASSNNRHSSRHPTAMTKKRYRRIRGINDEAIGDLPPVDGFA